jgi:general secretion pathway protein K
MKLKTRPKMKPKLTPLRRQRGVAVITALLLTTLAITIVASLFWAQQVQVRSMENQRLHLQTKWILRGALDWAGLVLRQDGRDNSYTSLDQVWATPLAETRLDQYIERERVEGEVFDATLSGSIIDATSRYNLFNLARQRRRDPIQVAVFQRLLTNLKLDPALAERTAAAIAASAPVLQLNVDPSQEGGATQSGGATQEGGGTQSGTGTGTSTGTQSGAAPVRLIQIDDLLAIPGFTVEAVDKLRDFVIVLPERTTVNVNTAPPEVLAAVIENFSLAEANSLVARRKSAAWRQMSYFNDQLNGKKTVDGAVDVVSNYFLVRSRVRLDRAALDAEALINRGTDARKVTTLVWVRQN